MDWVSVYVSALVTVIAGLALWALLPRGVVLTRARKANERDSWTIRNDSPLPIQLTSVRIAAPETVDLESHTVGEPDLPWDGILGVRLSLDDFTAEIARQDWQRAWGEVSVEPGDTLTAHVPTNTTLYLDYRRAGWSGVLERRSLVIHGGV